MGGVELLSVENISISWRPSCSRRVQTSFVLRKKRTCARTTTFVCSASATYSKYSEPYSPIQRASFSDPALTSSVLRSHVTMGPQHMLSLARNSAFRRFSYRCQNPASRSRIRFAHVSWLRCIGRRATM